MGRFHIDAVNKVIKDANNNEIFAWDEIVSAVNHVRIKNAATGNPAVIEAIGDDANISINLIPKGSGAVSIAGGNIYYVGGTDVAIADGGTGASSAASARTNLGVPPDTRNINTSTGLTGGGNLTVDRTLSVDITGLTAESVNADTDEVPIYDVSAAAIRKFTRRNFLKEVTFSNISDADSIPRWFKFTKSHTDFQAAATSNDVELVNLPAAHVIHAIKIKHTTAFSGGAIASYTISIGIVGNLTKYAGAFDVFQAVSNTAQQISSVVGTENHGAGVSIRAAAVSAGANLDQSAAGAVEIWVLVSKAN